MATIDISRNAFEPRKHYASVRMQQGRVITDDDWNENERIENEDRRRARVEVIGTSGSPDQGFRIANPRITDDDLIDFDIGAGTFYLGGLRLDMEESEEPGEQETFRTQKDYLLQRSDLSDKAPNLPRFDLVYLEAWQQPVSAVEDSELFEVALGGPDTSMRLRNMRQVLIHPDVESNDCALAWQKLVADWKVNKKGTPNKESERVPDASLKVTFVAGGNPDDLCTPLASGGYLGAENQAIRVQIVDQTHLTWGFDNASPLYRVEVNTTGETVTLLTDPKDQAHWPLAGQIVEILPWSAVLPNGEKLAGIQEHLSGVKSSYDPDEGTLTLTTPLSKDFGKEWTSRADKTELQKPSEYFFMRVWNRGADRTSEPEIAFTPDTPVSLGNTGLQVTISGDDRIPGDYWIIAARPETPNKVVPWEFEKGLAPHGVRRFYAPLAVIHWKRDDDGQIEGEVVHDCRKRFRPLTDQQICCTYTVGDGVHSQGDFDSIEDAVSNLPPWGGDICLLPGLHRASVSIERRFNVRIKGCDLRTLIIPRYTGTPIFHVADSWRITLEHMALATFGGTAIHMAGSGPNALQEVEVGHNIIFAYRHGIHVSQGDNIHIHNNRIRMCDRPGGDVAIFLLADDGLIERNDIAVIPVGTVPPETGEVEKPSPDPSDECAEPDLIENDPQYVRLFVTHVLKATRGMQMRVNPFRAFGGIQIGSGSERIKVLENRISGGCGNGITLGSDLDLTDITDESGEEEAVHTIHNEGKVIQGNVLFEGDPQPDFLLAFQKKNGVILNATTEPDGTFLTEADPGDYEVFIGNSYFRIDGIDTEGEVSDISHTINLVRAEEEADLMDVLAFIYDVTIEGNDISDMGLSGIGTPQRNLATLINLWLRQPGVLRKRPQWVLVSALARTFGVLSGFVIDLAIRGNHIFHCLQNAFGPPMQVLVALRGEGGLSLGLCENLVIQDNRIEENGLNHVQPVCGIFVSHADQADISHNQILDNGPLDQQAGLELHRGIRGGVVLRQVTSILAGSFLNQNTSTAQPDGSMANAAVNPVITGFAYKGGYAARMHDNLIKQPVGHALRMFALGQISILNNKFNTDFSEPVMNKQIAGAVLIRNLGQPYYLRTAFQKAPVSPLFPSGNSLFSHNQTRLGFAVNCWTSQMILTADDLAFDGNQSDVLQEIFGPLIFNTLLGALTLRASNNRLQEPLERRAARPATAGVANTLMSSISLVAKKISLFTFSIFLNNTTNNQGNHCVIALSTLKPAIDTDNQAIIEAGCQEHEIQLNSEQIKNNILQIFLKSVGVLL